MSNNLHNLLTDDSRIFHQPDLSYETAEKVVTAIEENGRVIFRIQTNFDNIMYLCIEEIKNGIFRIKAWKKNADFELTSKMLVYKETSGELELIEETDGYRVKGDKYTIVLNKCNFNISLFTNEGKLLWQTEGERIADKYLTPPLGFRHRNDREESFFSFRLQNDERLFGLGEKFNKVEKTGTRATIWAADTCGTNTLDLSYKSIPLLFSDKGWGVMLHSSTRNFWEVGSFSYTSGAVLVEEDTLDIFLFAGDDLKDLIYKYTDITGRPSPLPKWAFGVWVSKCAYESREEVETIANTMREKQIPFDVIHIDPKWMNTHYYFKIGSDACDFDWNHNTFPRPEEMFEELKEKGVSTCLWINPYLPIGTPIYELAKEKGYMVKMPDGGIAGIEGNNSVGLVDYTNPEAKEWWKNYLKELIRKGAEVFKPDYGERVPEESVFYNGKTGLEMHNLYMYLYGDAVYEAVKEEKGIGIVWRRSGYIGSQRFPGTWAGDTQTTWEGMRCCLRGGLSAGLSGEAFWSHDIGGFCGDKPSPELYTRWAQLGMFSPLTRFHGTTPREPWEYGEEAEKIVAHYSKIRYSLMPYILTAAKESYSTGVPIMRHMALEFPNEPNMHTLDDQFMLGSELLVAPILNNGQLNRFVYLPKGQWTELEDNSKTYQGGRFIEIEAPLNKIPVFVREGAIIPRYKDEIQHLKANNCEVQMDIYSGKRNNMLHFTDGSKDIKIAANLERSNIQLLVSGDIQKLNLNLIAVDAKEITCDEAEFRWVKVPNGTKLVINCEKATLIKIM